MIIKDDSCLEFVSKMMQGVIDYIESEHLNIFIDDGLGFICLSLCDNMASIYFAWHEGKRSTLKQMVRLGKDLYKQYTINKGIPIYYTGKTNLYRNNSEQIDKKLWVFKPKDY